MSEDQTITVLTQANEPVGVMALPTETFGGAIHTHLLYEMVKMQRANRRSGTAATKTRGSVRGGGKKPWRQKGTGRARAGSSRSPLWVGGATVFGPRPRSYSYRLPSSARRTALRSALALKAKDGQLVVVDKIEVEPPKTKTVAKMIDDLQLSSALIVTGTGNANLERAAGNLPRIKVVRADGANVYDILRHEHLVLTQDAVAVLEERVNR
jgi:large subunit ribosomal protein L4